MKDKRSHYDAMDKLYSDQKIYGSTSISFIVRKNWLYPPIVSGSYSQYQKITTLRKLFVHYMIV